MTQKQSRKPKRPSMPSLINQATDELTLLIDARFEYLSNQLRMVTDEMNTKIKEALQPRKQRIEEFERRIDELKQEFDDIL